MHEKKDILDHLKVNKITTPDSSYFDSLSERILSQQNTPAKVIPIYKKPVFWLTATAAAIVLLLFLPFGKNNQFNISEELDKIPEAEVKEYVDFHSHEFDEDLIYQALDYGTTTENQFIQDLLKEASAEIIPINTTLDFQDVNNQEIQEFLNDEGYETEELEVIFI